MYLKKFLFLVAGIFLLSIFFACEKTLDEELEEDTQESIEDTEDTADDADEENSGDHEETADYTWDNSQVVSVVLNGSSITVNGSGATVSGSKLTITAAGTYSLSGSLTNGQVIVNTSDKAIVRLILNGANITCSNNAPIDIENAEKAMIVLAENTNSILKDGTSYSLASGTDEPNAALYSASDLTIYGNGSLTVDANYNDGIVSKDGLIIKSGTITIDAVDDGIRGKDYLIVKSGTILLTAGGDGLKSDNEEDSTKGYISVETGTVTITAGGDAIAAETDVIIADGTFNLTSGGGSSKTVTSDLSAKGIKGVASVIIDKGIFTISSADDAIHSNGSVVINNGTFAISSGDDGIHADSSLGINGGEINITKSYEGIESKIIKTTAGTIHIKASDDGVNVAGGNDGSGMGGWPGNISTSGNYYLYINGGYIYVNATGDGIDVNGTIEMTAGTVIVDGPTSNGNGALDYDAGFKISGGFLIAAGSSGMAQAPGTTSTQNSVLINFTSSRSAGTLINIQTSAGKELFTFAAAKSYQSIAFSSPDITKGTTYDVYSGGNSTGTVTDGLYSNGVYSSGTKYTSFTVLGTTTKITSK
ncbi:MAG: hypothetical protein A2W90_13015 [Bacteroidetes bacterium GWF2_42_66]|nr:MAG: hypothetical protein A2W89_18005 [Bacteroidetes bacterium GWE2_42_39]OFY40283.1 MAG: hypothetical protein A2W90_13015 [Bacteroidetes bacterium GWF2_42_66]HBL73736.1 dockerin type 1 [Prolixibacteraceae bacterium]HCU61457.1 dockerin type 1 [Prolixibacteraceae bacterium]